MNIPWNTAHFAFIKICFFNQILILPSKDMSVWPDFKPPTYLGYWHRVEDINIPTPNRISPLNFTIILNQYDLDYYPSGLVFHGEDETAHHPGGERKSLTFAGKKKKSSAEVPSQTQFSTPTQTTNPLHRLKQQIQIFSTIPSGCIALPLLSYFYGFSSAGSSLRQRQRQRKRKQKWRKKKQAKPCQN